MRQKRIIPESRVPLIRKKIVYMNNKLNSLPRRDDFLRIEWGKLILMSIIVLTSMIPLLYIDTREPTSRLLLFKVLAKTGSLAGMVLFAWQFLLGFRGVVSLVIKDLVWVVNFHKRLGQGASILILLHPVFITLYYLDKFDRNIIFVDLTEAFDWYVILGIIALVIVALIYLTSVPFRKYLTASKWFTFHLSSYCLLTLGFIHSFAIGMTIRETSLRIFWIILTVVMAGFLGYRLLFRFGIFSSLYITNRVAAAARQVIDISLRPEKKPVVPRMGQFIYIRRKAFQGAHAYTVSDFNHQTGELAITAKAQGITSTELQGVQPGERIAIDGPYGVFTWHALLSDLPLVMIAGGIGITPFRRLIRLLERDRHRPAWLFYGCERAGDVVYRDKLDSCRHVKVVYVLNSEPEYPGEKGFITTSMMRKYLSGDFSGYEFLLCGPPGMITKLETSLAQAGVPPEQIHHELFSW
ncbi:MAG: hypothetical protein GF401_16300 [Chitinivibrionales bacterium]|nr:hypothetical protein [Chitinivibrionales bacterium]